MIKLHLNEKAKEFHVEAQLKYRYAITNFGRLISFTDKIENGRVLKGSLCEGYRIFTYKEKLKDGTKANRHLFLGKLVAQHFLRRYSDAYTQVLHLDYNRANDHYQNLKWATREQMIEHSKKSPYVIAAFKKLVQHNIESDGHKLTVNQVKFIKKRLADPNRKIRMKMLAKQFNISEMQLYRIKRGENWGHIKV